MHNAAFRACGLPHQYSVLELPDEGGLDDVNSETSQQFRDYLASPDFGGLSVTIPHKLRVQPFLDELTDAARRIGAVNTITPRPAVVTSGTTLGGASVLTCVEIKFTARSCCIIASSSTPSTRRLLDGVAMPVPRRSTEPARPRHHRDWLISTQVQLMKLCEVVQTPEVDESVVELVDGVAVSIPHRSTEPGRSRHRREMTS